MLFVLSFIHVFGDSMVRSCSKTFLATVLIRSIFAREKLHERFSASAVFQRNELTQQQDMFCFNHASAFYTSNNIVKNVDE